MTEGGEPPGLRRGTLAPLGLRSTVVEAGPPATPEAVVFLHGNPGSSRDWDDLLPRVAQFGRAIAFDLPGYGRAVRPPTWGYSPADYAEFIGAALDELGVERAHLVMHDLGGMGLLWAANDPDRFASAVLIDTGNLTGFRWHWVARLYRTRFVGELLARIFGGRVFALGLRMLERQPRRLPRAVIERMAADYDYGTRRAALRFYRATPAEVMGLLAPLLAPLDRPAVVLWGRHDPFVSVQYAARQREGFPGAEIVVLEDSGHWPFLDDPDRAAAAMVPFLRRQLEANGGAERRVRPA